MELSKRQKTVWKIEAMYFVNLTKEQLTEIKSYSRKKNNQDTQYLIYDYNTIEVTLSMYSISEGSINGKLKNLQTIPECTDSLYYYAVAAGSISSMYCKPDSFDECAFEDSKETFEDYLEEVSEDFTENFNFNVEKILELEAELA